MSALRERLRRQLGAPTESPQRREELARPPAPATPELSTPEPRSVGERLERMFRRRSAPAQSVRRAGQKREVVAAEEGGVALGSHRFAPPSRPPRTDPSRPTTHPPVLERELRGDAGGAWFHCAARLEAGHRHGRVVLDHVLDVGGQGAVVLSGDPDLSGFDPTRALFFDLETTGLMGGGGNLAFIVGVAQVDATGAVDLVQYLLREPGDEPALLEGLAPLLRSCQALVSFNGKSFDRHVLADRFVMNRMDPSPALQAPHLDLIHPARRLYRTSLPSCSLGALEESCLGVFREHDLPGSEAPAAWFAWLRTGDASAVARVQDHNALDLLSLVALTAHLDRCVRAPGAALPEPAALAQAGRLLVERGEEERGEQVLGILARGDAADPVVYGALHVLGEHLRRAGRTAEALPLWERMRAAAGVHDLHPWVAAAIALEHRLGRPDEAMALVDRALADLQASGAFVAPEERTALERRRERLAARCGRARPAHGAAANQEGCSAKSAGSMRSGASVQSG